MGIDEKVKEKRSTPMMKFISLVEKGGNKLPHPFMIFVWLIGITVLLSMVLSLLGVSALHPRTQEEIGIQNLLSKQGVVFMFKNLYRNFAAYPPLGLVITMLLGVGVAENTGLLAAFMKRFILKAPPRLLVGVIFLVGICGNIASDVAVVLIPPLAGVIFYGAGRNPIVGVVAGYAAACAGFTANLLIAGTDVLLAGITTPAAQFMDPDITVLPTANYYFMIASTLILTVVGSWVTVRYVEKQAGPYVKPEGVELEDVSQFELKPEERRGLRRAGVATLLFLGAVLLLVLPPFAPFRDAQGTVNPFLRSLVAFLFFWFLIIGTVYGKSVGVIKKAGDVPKFMVQAIRGLAPALVLFFVAAQFMALFNWANLGTVLSIGLGGWLKAMNIGGIGFIIAVVLVTMLINLLIGSSSAKWAILAPILVPLFMNLDYSPQFAQLAYRIGDSTTNAIIPISPYFVMALGFMQKYDKRIGMGNLIAWALPYSLFFGLVWIVMLIVWMLLGIPLGPGAPVFLP